MHLHDIGDRLSWFEFRCWLKYLREESATVRLRQERTAADAVPRDQRTVGSDPIPLDEMNSWLGWDKEEVGA